MDVAKVRKNASELSLGSSSDIIIETVLEQFLSLNLDKNIKLMDVGCGQGHLLSRVKSHGYSNLTGCDYSDFQGEKDFEFFQHDCNEKLPVEDSSFDCLLCSEVIEHIENPWHFIRELIRVLKPGGSLVLSTPNPESWLSILTLVVKGYYNAFGPKDYPAHITPVSVYEITNMVNVTNAHIKKVHYIPNGRVPGSGLMWKQVIPSLDGKRFADNYIIIASK
ncbi:MAG: methyltransferase domain-containing protein [Oligoflexia bacterium]|nr:methyltransferase domain-containing protein [Oligoflexia bacterium]